MKKFGTPSGAGPGSASEYVGLRGDGTPLPLGSLGAGLRWREARRPRLWGKKACDDCGSERLGPSSVGADGAGVERDVVVELVVDEDDELEVVVRDEALDAASVDDVVDVVVVDVVVVVVDVDVVVAVVDVVEVVVGVDVVALVDDDAVVLVVVWDCVVGAAWTKPACGAAGTVVARARSAPPAKTISASAQQHVHVLQRWIDPGMRISPSSTGRPPVRRGTGG